MNKYEIRKNYRRYKKYSLIFLGVLFIFISFMYLLKYLNKNNNYVLKINGEYIKKEEFLLYLDEQERIFEEIGGIDIWHTDFDGIPAKDVAKNNTINSIVLLKSIVYESKKLGLKLTIQEKETCKKEAMLLQEKFKTDKNIIIPLDICEKFEIERLIEEKMYDYITSTFVVNEKDFENYFEKYIMKNSNEINEVYLDYIFIQNNSDFNAKQKANDIIKNINFEMDFKTFEEQPFIQIYKNVKLEKNLFEKNIEDKIYKLGEKSISNIIEGRDGFYIFKINKILKPDIQDVKEVVKEEYINIKKSEIYSIQTKNWASNIKLEKNNEILSNI